MAVVLGWQGWGSQVGVGFLLPALQQCTWVFHGALKLKPLLTPVLLSLRGNLQPVYCLLRRAPVVHWGIIRISEAACVCCASVSYVTDLGDVTVLLQQCTQGKAHAQLVMLL